MKPLEKTIEARLREYARNRGVLFLKFESPGSAGVPDRIVIGQGIVAFLELKRPGGTPRPLQRAWLAKLRDRGIWCGWVDSAESGKSAIDSVVAGSHKRWTESVKT